MRRPSGRQLGQVPGIVPPPQRTEQPDQPQAVSAAQASRGCEPPVSSCRQHTCVRKRAEWTSTAQARSILSGRRRCGREQQSHAEPQSCPGQIGPSGPGPPPLGLPKLFWFGLPSAGRQGATCPAAGSLSSDSLRSAAVRSHHGRPSRPSLAASLRERHPFPAESFGCLASDPLERRATDRQRGPRVADATATRKGEAGGPAPPMEADAGRRRVGRSKPVGGVLSASSPASSIVLRVGGLRGRSLFRPWRAR